MKLTLKNPANFLLFLSLFLFLFLFIFCNRIERNIGLSILIFPSYSEKILALQGEEFRGFKGVRGFITDNYGNIKQESTADEEGILRFRNIEDESPNITVISPLIDLEKINLQEYTSKEIGNILYKISEEKVIYAVSYFDFASYNIVIPIFETAIAKYMKQERGGLFFYFDTTTMTNVKKILISVPSYNYIQFFLFNLLPDFPDFFGNSDMIFEHKITEFQNGATVKIPLTLDNETNGIYKIYAFAISEDGDINGSTQYLISNPYDVTEPIELKFNLPSPERNYYFSSDTEVSARAIGFSGNSAFLSGGFFGESMNRYFLITESSSPAMGLGMNYILEFDSYGKNVKLKRIYEFENIPQNIIVYSPSWDIYPKSLTFSGDTVAGGINFSLSVSSDVTNFISFMDILGELKNTKVLWRIYNPPEKFTLAKVSELFNMRIKKVRYSIMGAIDIVETSGNIKKNLSNYLWIAETTE